MSTVWVKHTIKMNLIQILIFGLLIKFKQSATIPKQVDTLDILKKDVSQVGNAIENFTFDILKGLLEQSSSEETQESTTISSKRKKRSAEEEIENLCHKRCEEAHKLETQQIKDLKGEVQKLQEVVKLLQDQQAIIKILDKNSTKNGEAKKARAGAEIEDVSYLEDLAKIKNDVKDIIVQLNQTRELIKLQKKKDEILEDEIIKQKHEILNLRTRVEIAFPNDTLLQKKHETQTPKARASELSDLRKLLKNLPEDDDDDDDPDEDLRSKIKELEKSVGKKKKQQSLMRELKHLEKSLDEKPDDSKFFKQFMKALKKSEANSRSDDLDINNLSDLEEAISRLRPKEDQTSQFQAMLTKLITSQNVRPSQISVGPQQMNQQPNKFSTPFCLNDDGIKNNPFRSGFPRNYQSPPYDYYNKGQFFPGQFTQQNYYTQGNANGNPYDKSGSYQGENVAVNQKYQDELRQQIDGLQAAIDNLNRPEYVQRPEDKAVVDNLEQQIGELRDIVNNLNYDSNNQNYQRNKRSLKDNEVDNSKELVEKLIGEIINENATQTAKPELTEIQEKIENLKKQIDDGNSKTRAASSYYPPALTAPPIFLPESTTLEKSSSKSDLFSDILGRIIDKILQAVPVVLQRLFNFGFQEMLNFDGQDYDLQVLSKNLGFFAHMPIILLRLLRGFSAFMNMLRKNSLFKNFLLPAIVLGTVAGSVLFLIWWLQPDDYQYGGYIGGDSYYQGQVYQQPQQQQHQQNQQYPASYNMPVYSRSYLNK